MNNWIEIGYFRFRFDDDVLTYQRRLIVETICGCYRTFKHYDINSELNEKWNEIMHADIKKMVEQLKNPQKDMGFEINFLGSKCA